MRMIRLRDLLLPLLFLCALGLLPTPSCGQPTGELLLNGGFEGGSGSDGMGGGVPRWKAFELGYEIDRQVHHSGDQCIRCDSLRPKTLHGASVTVTLNQAHAVPILVSGWSKADQVGGVKDGDYSLYVDIEYTDGTPLWGLNAPFQVGSHDWQRKQILIIPAKPVRTLSVFALFRNHMGTSPERFRAEQQDFDGSAPQRNGRLRPFWLY